VVSCPDIQSKSRCSRTESVDVALYGYDTIWGSLTHRNQTHSVTGFQSIHQDVIPDLVLFSNYYGDATPSLAQSEDPIDVLKRDKDGNPIFHKIGSEVSPDPGRAGPATLQPGELETVDGLRIPAYQNTSSNMAWDTDCHGYTVADGKYWINNGDMQNYLDNTTQVQVTSNPSIGDWVVYRDSGGSVVHSGIYSDSGKITMAAGTVIYPGPSKTTTVPVTDGWSADGTTTEYWTKK
jgi:hypothetical protein